MLIGGNSTNRAGAINAHIGERCKHAQGRAWLPDVESFVASCKLPLDDTEPALLRVYAFFILATWRQPLSSSAPSHVSTLAGNGALQDSSPRRTTAAGDAGIRRAPPLVSHATIL
jgi:hypothetical protein